MPDHPSDHPSIAKQERARLAAELLERGPDAPTLCEGWTNYDMAAHLVVREHQPLASVGITVARFASLHDDAIVKAKQKHTYESLVERFRGGPPLHWKLIDDLFNSQEYFVHDEDVRRGDGETGPRPADEVGDLEDGLWKMLRRGGKFAVRGIKGVGVDVVRDTGDVIHARDASPKVTIVGRPGEIVLYLAGRRGAAQVELQGDDEAIAVLQGAKLGI